jgi:hypothetical protein
MHNTWRVGELVTNSYEKSPQLLKINTKFLYSLSFWESTSVNRLPKKGELVTNSYEKSPQLLKINTKFLYALRLVFKVYRSDGLSYTHGVV